MMKSYMTPELYNYDVYPKAFLADRETTADTLISKRDMNIR